MDLRTFVAETLSQIVDGVADAKKLLADGETGALLNPSYAKPIPSPVEFDVALTVAQRTDDATAAKAGAKGGIVAVFQAQAGVDLEHKAAKRSEEVSRVRFTVMLAQPGEVTPKQHVTIPSAKTGW